MIEGMDKCNNLAEDLLEGANAIAVFLGWTPRQVYNACEKGCLPIHKVPGIGITARKSALLAFFDHLDAPYIDMDNNRCAS